jgi:coenzyme F420-0:L-glutamate ligase/coenzyme F420-1:gamma-L-glutamate ligase
VPATFDGVAVTAEPAGTTPDDLVRFGADVHRLRAALAAEGVATTLRLELGSSRPHAVLRL